MRLVLDDFGTGYSSLAYLNRFPFDALKIDRSFVDALGIEQERTAIIEAIIGMARALSLDVIAEGVENEAQLSELRRLGCDYAQGHLFSPALPLGRGHRPARRWSHLALFGNLPRQVGVAEHFGCGGSCLDQFVVPHPGDEVAPLARVHVAVGWPSRLGANSGSVAFTSAAVSFGSRLWLASKHRFGGGTSGFSPRPRYRDRGRR